MAAISRGRVLMIRPIMNSYIRIKISKGGIAPLHYDKPGAERRTNAGALGLQS